MGDLPEKHELMEEAREALAKTLGPTEVLALALGAIVGWGCFMLPGITFLPNAGPLGTIIAFFIGAFFQCIVALGYSFLIKPYPVAGGAFVYAYAGFGSKGAFICGWALVLSYVCVIAANATAIILLALFLGSPIILSEYSSRLKRVVSLSARLMSHSFTMRESRMTKP